MNRRQFLRNLAAVAATATLDPEQLLWVPRQMISVPSGFQPITYQGQPLVFDQFSQAIRVYYLPRVEAMMNSQSILLSRLQV